MAASRSSTNSVISAPPARPGSSWMYSDRSSATVQTTSESLGKNAGSPRSCSYHARAAARSRTRIPAKSAMVMAVTVSRVPAVRSRRGGHLVEHVAQSARERLGLAGVAELAAEEAAVVAREHGHLLTEQLGGRDRG